jgi:hypothetical protein
VSATAKYQLSTRFNQTGYWLDFDLLSKGFERYKKETESLSERKASRPRQKSRDQAVGEADSTDTTGRDWRT